MYPCSHWSIIVGCPGARQRVPNQRHGHWHWDTQVPSPVRPLFLPCSPPIGWTIFIPAPIGPLFQVALEHASVRLINATATSTEILKSWSCPTFVFPPTRLLLVGQYLPCTHWTITAGCPWARQCVPNQRDGQRYGDTPVSRPVWPLFFPPLASYWLDNIYPAPIVQLL